MTAEDPRTSPSDVEPATASVLDSDEAAPASAGSTAADALGTPDPLSSERTQEPLFPADDAVPAARKGRRVAVIVAAVVVVAAALLVAVQFGPSDDQAVPVAATTSPSVTKKPSTSPTPPAQPSVPQETGQFAAWASRTSEWLDIPLRAMDGYANATVTLTREQPGCHLSWVTLAALGKVATDHGRAQGDHVGPNGVLEKPLGTLDVRDFSDHVVSVPDASGPLQLAPAVWDRYRTSASGGKPDPQNVDDAALTAGKALCAGGRDLSQGQTWWDAVSTLQSAPVVLHRTLATVNVYGTVGQGTQAPNPSVLSAVDFAIDKIGLPYVWGGNGTGGADPGFDCSGLTTAAYASAGVKLMRTADTQFRSVPHVSEPQLGDLIFFGEPGTFIHHVGLYIGNQQMIDAPQTGQAVQVHPYRRPGDDFAGAGRPVA